MMKAADPATEHARLSALMQGYLAALVAREARPLRPGARLRCTENTCELPPGSGVARTIRALKPGGHTFVDAAHGQVEYWGAIDEMGAEAIFGVRLRVEGLLVSEIETLVVRGGGSFFEPSVVTSPAPQFHSIIPPAERTPRQELIDIANVYFDAIERSDGTRLPVADDCVRLVNGVTDSRMDAAAVDPAEAHRSLGVAEQMSARHYAYIEALRARRYPVVDEARGIVVAHVMFDHPGDLPRADGTLPFRAPNSMLAFEAFKVRGGVLREVWAIGTALPYGIGSGW